MRASIGLLPQDASPASSSLASSAGDASITAAEQKPNEWVTRPTGLRRGVWEGPAWLFGVVAGVLVAVAIAYAIYRIGPKRIAGAFRRKRSG
jgi:hypothetical protein